MAGRIELVAVFGGTTTNDMACVPNFAFGIGRMLARSSRRIITGAGPGYPDHVLRGYLSAEPAQRPVLLSPWRDEARHRGESYPVHHEVDVEYTGLGPGRSALLITRADAVLGFPLGLGAMSDLLTALQLLRPVFVYRERDRDGLEQVIADRVQREHASTYTRLIRVFHSPNELYSLLSECPAAPTKTW